MGCLATSTVAGNPGPGIARTGSFILLSFGLIAALLSAPVAADDTQPRLLTIHLASDHFGAEGYNGRNPGLGLRLGKGDWYGAVGFYKNSLNRDSVYAGGGKTLARRGPVSFNLNAGIVTGYDMPAAPFISPEAVLDFGRVRAMVGYFPKMAIAGTKTEHVLAVSVGVPF